ncbi:MAG: branched-chain amino acid aminotransferase [Flavobacteriales bacterium]|nr:branched-chain amino acid aminotransferase [Flavobacteriales bacterium]
MISTDRKIAIHPTQHSRLSGIDLETVVFGRVFSDHMFVMDYRDGQWQQPVIEPYGKMEMSPALITLHYGQSIFEGQKAYRSDNGHVSIFRPKDNIARMNRSAHRMCMPEIPEDIFLEGMTELVRMDHKWIPRDAEGALYIRPFMYASDEYVGVRPSDTYRFIIFTCPVRGYYKDAVRVKIETEYSRAFPGGTGAAKCSGNYASSLYPAKLAADKGFHQILWTDGETHEYFEESGTMNVFFRIGDTLMTPETSGTILEGITRDSIIRIAKQEGIDMQVRRVSVAEVTDAIRKGTLKEAFGAGTAATIAHIASIAYGNEEYTLPNLAESSFSNHVAKVLDDIRRGRTADPFGWMLDVGV